MYYFYTQFDCQHRLNRENGLLMQNKKVLLLGRLAFDPDLNVLSISTQSNTKLTPKESALLLYLYENKNTVVQREDLLKHIWQERFGADESLSKAISNLRRKIDHLGLEGKTLIQTVAKRGYILSIEKSPLDSEPDASPNTEQKAQIDHSQESTSRYFILKLTLFLGCLLLTAFFILPEEQALSAPEKKTKVLLVLSSDKGQTENQPFLDGLAKNVIFELAKNSSLQMISPATSTLVARHVELGPTFLTKHEVQHFFEGVLIQSQNDYRLTIKVSDSARGHSKELDTITVSSGGIHNLEEALINVIKRYLGLSTNSAEQVLTEPTNLYGPKGMDYFDYLVLKGRYSFSTPSNLVELQDELQSLIQKYPEFVSAKIDLSLILSTRANWAQITPEYAFQSSSALLLPHQGSHKNDSSYHAALGIMQGAGVTTPKFGDVEAAIRHLHKSIEIVPSNDIAIFYLKRISGLTGNWDTYNEMLAWSAAINPLDLATLSQQSLDQFMSGAHVASEATARSIMTYYPDNPDGYSRLAYALFAQHKYVDVANLAKACIQADPKFMNCYEHIIRVLIMLGDEQALFEVLEQFKLLAPPVTDMASLLLAFMQGDEDKARFIMERLAPEDMKRHFLAQPTLLALSMFEEGQSDKLKNRLVTAALNEVNESTRVKFAYLLIPAEKTKKDVQIVLERLKGIPNKGPRTLRNIAELEALLGNKSRAIDTLKQLYSQTYFDSFSYVFYRFEDNPFFADLREEPSFRIIEALYSAQIKRYRMALTKEGVIDYFTDRRFWNESVSKSHTEAPTTF